jgi:hypothetical protein
MMMSYGIACTYLFVLFVLPSELFAILQCQQTLNRSDIFFLSHRTTQAIEMSKKFLDDERLFGVIKTDAKLSREGNLVCGIID